jgi:hypothetical protein
MGRSSGRKLNLDQILELNDERMRVLGVKQSAP